jgi:hypothetical protein
MACLWQHRVPAQAFVGSDQPSHVFRHRLHRRRLPFHHVTVEVGWPPHRLARVVDDEIEALSGRQQLTAERLDAWRVPQIESKDLEPVAPVGKVSFARIALCGVARKARRDDDVGAGAQQLERGLVADLHPAAGHQRDASVQVGELGPLAEVEGGAAGAQLIVEVMDQREVLLADVTVWPSSRNGQCGCDVFAGSG